MRKLGQNRIVDETRVKKIFTVGDRMLSECRLLGWTAPTFSLRGLETGRHLSSIHPGNEPTRGERGWLRRLSFLLASMPPQSFRERVDTTASIKSILDSYPFGNGLLRELLQNSDDAGATNQVCFL
jgi:hypothetical protein